MSKSSTITIACALCVGAAPEPYLAAALAAIAPAVDVLVVNDNSGLARSDNIATLQASAFAARGDLHVIRTAFVDFADMRNRAYAAVGALARAPDWMLFLDADEVHGEQIRGIARDLLPRLSPDYAHVDAYTYHLYGSYRWLTDVARRFCFYRYTPAIAWVNAVHEKIAGLRGAALVLPYVYHHYGNVIAPAALAQKYQRYHTLGNPVAEPPNPRDASVELFIARAADVRPYSGPHPVAVRPTLRELGRTYARTFALVDAGFVARRSLVARGAATVRGVAETVRVELRRIEHAGLYRDSTRAR